MTEKNLGNFQSYVEGCLQDLHVKKRIELKEILEDLSTLEHIVNRDNKVHHQADHPEEIGLTDAELTTILNSIKKAKEQIARYL